MKKFKSSKRGKKSGRGAPRFRRIEKDDGAALILSLLFLVLLALMAPVAMRMTSSDAGRTADLKEAKMAFYIAEAGVEQAKATIKTRNFDALLKGADNNSATTADNGLFVSVTGATTVASGGNNYSRVSYNGGNYSVRIYDNNDGDGDLYNDADGVAIVESVGAYKGKTTTLHVTLRKQNINSDSFPAAVTMVGPTANITAQGSGFEVDGHGTTTSGASDPNCADQHGIATEATNAHTTEDLSGNAENKIDGVDGNHDISHSETTFTYSKAVDFYDQVTPLAATTWTSNQTLSGGQTLGTTASPAVSYAKGNLTIHGNVSGVGVLIVDGDLDISGSLNFQGVILVGVCSTCTGTLAGTGSATIYGAMVVGNQIDASAKFTGSANIMYSCQALNNAAGSLSGTLKVVSWKES